MFVDQTRTGEPLANDIGGKEIRHTFYFFGLLQTGTDNKHIFFDIVCPKMAACC
jgi:hypothetical protein